MTTVTVVEQLAEVARERVEAEGKAILLRDRTDELVLRGVKEGVPKLRLAREAGLSRATVDKIVLRDAASRAA